MKQRKRIVTLLVAASMCASVLPSQVSEAAKKTRLSAKSIVLKVGQTKKIQLKKNKKTVKWSIVSGKGIIRLKNRKKNGVSVLGLKKGKAKIRAKAGKAKYFCKVIVQGKKIQKPQKKTIPNVPQTVPMVTNPPAVPNPVPNTPNTQETSSPDMTNAKYWMDEISVSLPDVEEYSVSYDRIYIPVKIGEHLKDVIPDVSKQRFQVNVNGLTVNAVVGNSIWHEEPYYSNGLDDGYYSFDLYFIMNGISYYRTFMIVSEVAVEKRETVCGTIKNHNQILKKEYFTALVFEGKNETYHAYEYDGEKYEGQVPEGTYSVYYQCNSNCSGVFLGETTIKKGIVNEINFDMNVTVLKGTVTKNGGKYDKNYADLSFMETESGSISPSGTCSMDSDEDNSYMIALPEGTYMVSVEGIKIGKIQITGLQSEMVQDVDVKISDIILGQQMNCTLPEDGADVVFEFTPSETALYELKGLYVDEECKVDWNINTQNSSTGSSYSLTDREDQNHWINFTDDIMVEGTTYQIIVSGVNLTKDVNTALLIEKSTEPENIELGQIKLWNEKSGGVHSYYYTFTAPEDGLYRFIGSAQKDQALGNWEFVSFTAEGVSGSLYKRYEFAPDSLKGTMECEANLKKGEVVVILIYVNSYTMSGDFQICKG